MERKEKATVRITRREQREYGMHGSNKWDDCPFWQTYTIWDVASDYMDLNKKIFPTRKSFWNDTQTQKEAEDFALELALELENKGLEIRLEFIENGEGHNYRLKGGEENG
jgi:hypothetical protein